MKFLQYVTPESSCPSPSWACPCGVQDIPGPSHRLSCRYSMRHNPQPRNIAPNISSPERETPFAGAWRNVPSVSSPKYLRSRKVGIPRAYEYGRCLPPLSEYGRSPHRRPVSANHGTEAGDPLSIPCSDISSPKQDDSLDYLSNVNSFGSSTSNKAKTFIETKVTAMKLQGFNL